MENYIKEQEKEMDYCLYSPLYLEMTYYDNEEYGGMDYWSDEVSAEEGARYLDEVSAAIEQCKVRGKEETGLMEYFECEDKNLQESILQKVSYANPTVTVMNNELYGVMEMKLKASLNRQELRELKDYFRGQYSDGWGESFEQREIKTADGELCVSFWRYGYDFYLDTKEEFLSRTGIDVEEMQEESFGMNMY